MCGEQAMGDLGVENSSDRPDSEVVVEGAGVLRAGMEDLGDGVALEDLGERGLVDVAHRQHVEQVACLAEHKLSELVSLCGGRPTWMSVTVPKRPKKVPSQSSATAGRPLRRSSPMHCE